MESSKQDWTLSGTATALYIPPIFFLKIHFLVPKCFYIILIIKVTEKEESVISLVTEYSLYAKIKLMT